MVSWTALSILTKTVYLYFPIYQTPPGDICSIGKAFICFADDECGTNKAHHLPSATEIPDGSNAEPLQECAFVSEGILSELVVFGDTLFANVAGPKEDADTLYAILSAVGEVTFKSQHWRESGF